jgi:hypothetical protein
MLEGTAGLFFVGGGLLGVLAGCLGIWRPSFLLPLAFHYVAFRNQFNVINGIDVSETDYRSMLDIVIFATVGSFMAIAAARAFSLRRSNGTLVSSDEFKSAAAALIWACSIGAHLGNYLVSGWTKVRAGGDDPLFWLLHNPTQTSILIGLERGDNPLALWPHLVQFSWDAIVTGGVFLNLFVLGTQLCVPLAVSHRRALMIFVLLFDLFHIVVYTTLGALFHFWIVVNVLVYISARRMTDKDLSIPVKATALIAMLAGHYLFYTSHLGWLDGAKLASPSYKAETKDGRIIPVPSVYFGLPSYSIAQTVMYIPDGHFPIRIGGNTYNQADWRDSQACGPEIIQHHTTGVSANEVDKHVRETDAAMRRHPFVKRDNLYYFYPHHMVANPFMFRDFNRLSIEDIVRYHYVVESVCLHLQDGRLVRDVHKRTDHVVNVQN